MRTGAQAEPTSKFVGIWIWVSTMDHVKDENSDQHERQVYMYVEIINTLIIGASLEFL